METPFTIKREAVLQSGDHSLVLLFDRLASRSRDSRQELLLPKVTDCGDLLYPNGLQDQHARHLVETAPRTLWLLAKAMLVPLDETVALRLIRDAGVALEPLPLPVATVQHFDASSSKSLLLAQISRRGQPVRPSDTVGEVKVVRMGGEDE